MSIHGKEVYMVHIKCDYAACNHSTDVGDIGKAEYDVVANNVITSPITLKNTYKKIAEKAGMKYLSYMGGFYCYLHYSYIEKKKQERLYVEEGWKDPVSPLDDKTHLSKVDKVHLHNWVYFLRMGAKLLTTTTPPRYTSPVKAQNNDDALIQMMDSAQWCSGLTLHKGRDGEWVINKFSPIIHTTQKKELFDEDGYKTEVEDNGHYSAERVYPPIDKEVKLTLREAIVYCYIISYTWKLYCEDRVKVVIPPAYYL